MQTKKLSQTLAAAIKLQKEIDNGTHAASESTVYYCRRGLCFVLNELVREYAVDWKDAQAAKDAIGARLGKYGLLWQFLKAQKKGASLAHRIAWYERWIAQLEAKGL